MRTKFFECLYEEMEKDEKIVLICADMGRGIIERFQEKFAQRVLNIGIAEQNMIGFAAGLCNAGYRPFCYTISNFITQRCFEQIRDDICITNYPITLIGSSTGFDAGVEGDTHYALDDIGVMKVLPNMRIYSPSTINAIGACFTDIIDEKQPAYIRIGKGSYNDEQIHSCNGKIVTNYGAKKVIITHGNILDFVVEAAQQTKNTDVYYINKIKPVSYDEISYIISKYDEVIVVEEHFASSGLYNTLCQMIVENKLYGTKIEVIAPKDEFPSHVGSKIYFADKYGYSPEKLAQYLSRST